MWWKRQSVSFIVNYFSNHGHSQNGQKIYFSICQIIKILLIRKRNQPQILSFCLLKLERKFHDIPIVAFNQIVGDNLLGWRWCTVKLLSPNVCQAPQANTALPNTESKHCRQGKFSGEEYFQIGPETTQ